MTLLAPLAPKDPRHLLNFLLDFMFSQIVPLPFPFHSQTAFFEVPRYEPDPDAPDDASKNSMDSTALKAHHGLELVSLGPRNQI